VTTVGFATLEVIPSLRDIHTNLTRQLTVPAARAGAQAGETAGRSFAQRFAARAADLAGVPQAIRDKVLPGAQQVGDEAGTAASGRFAGAFKAGLQALAATTGTAATGMVLLGVKGAAALETTNTAFTSLLGSAQAATQQIQSLQAFAAKTPFSQEDVLGYAQQYYALAESVGFAKDQVQPFLTAIGDVAAVTGASTENIRNAVTAIGQIGSSGKVTLENLNQVSEAFPGFNAAAAIAAATGKSTAEVLDEISKGSLDAKTGVQALVEGMRKFPGAAGAMAAQSATLNGMLSTFSDTVNIALTQAFQPLLPTIKNALGDLVPIISGSLGKVAPQIVAALAAVIPAAVDAFRSLATSAGPLAEVFSKLVTTFGPPLLELFTTIHDVVSPIVGLLASAVSGLLTVLGPVVRLLGSFGGPILATVFAFRLLNGVLGTVSKSLNLASRALGTFGLGNTRLATGMSTAASAISAASFGITAAIGLMTLAWQNSAQAAAESRARVQEWTSELEQSNGVIDENIKKNILKKLLDSDMADLAKKYGLSLSDLTGYIYGNAAATAKVEAATKGHFGAATALLGVIRPLRDEFRESVKNNRILAQTQREAAAAAKLAAGTGQGIAAGLAEAARSAVGLGRAMRVVLDLAKDTSGTSFGNSIAVGLDLAIARADTLGQVLNGILTLASSVGNAIAVGVGSFLPGTGAGHAIGDYVKDNFDPVKAAKAKAPPPPPFDKSLLDALRRTATGEQVNPLVDALNSILASAREAGKKLSSGFVTQLRAENSQLIALVKRRDQIAEQLAAAQQKLADARRDRAAERATVAGAVRGSFDVSRLTTLYREPVTIRDLLAQLRTAASKAARFGVVLRKLAREGLPNGLLQQLAEAGPSALQEAEALLKATPAQFAAVKAQYAKLNRAAASTGGFVAGELYDAGVKSAEGLVAGLKAKESKVLQAIRELANKMVAQFRAALGIHSPSRVGIALGGNFGEGIAQGIGGKYAAVAGEVDRLANAAASTRLRPPAGRPGAFGGGGTFTFEQHIHSPMTPTTGPSSPAAMRAAAAEWW